MTIRSDGSSESATIVMATCTSMRSHEVPDSSPEPSQRRRTCLPTFWTTRKFASGLSKCPLGNCAPVSAVLRHSASAHTPIALAERQRHSTNTRGAQQTGGRCISIRPWLSGRANSPLEVAPSLGWIFWRWVQGGAFRLAVEGISESSRQSRFRASVPVVSIHSGLACTATLIGSFRNRDASGRDMG